MTTAQGDNLLVRRVRLRAATAEELARALVFTAGEHTLTYGHAWAYGSASVTVHGSASVRAHGSASVRAHGSASVRAHGSASVIAYGSAIVRAHGSAIVRAHGSAIVRAHDSVKAVAFDESTITCRSTASWGLLSLADNAVGILRGGDSGVEIIAAPKDAAHPPDGEAQS